MSIAARLAKAGFKVTLLEKNTFTGGRCSILHHEGYRFDQGPSLLLLPRLFEETFRDLGTSLLDEGVDLLKCEPNYSIFFADGEVFQLSTDTTVMKREVERWEGKQGFEHYLEWLGEAHRHYEISVIEVLHKNFESITGLLRLSFLKNLFALHPFESIYSRASRYFQTERLRKVFTFATMYMGMSPFDAPGTYSLLQYTELTEGIWYPAGGFHRIVRALVDICQRSDVSIKLGTPVKGITSSVDGKRATGVELESGEKLTADIVVVNADLVYAYRNLFPQQPGDYAESLQKRAESCSSISFYWALDRQVLELKTHNIFLAEEYRSSFDSIFKDQSIPDDPSFYVNVPSRIDSSAAPKDKDSIVVLVPVGHLLRSSTTPDNSVSPTDGIAPEQDWEAVVRGARQTVLKTIAARTGIDITNFIIHEQINTPQTWESRFNLNKGSILGLSHSFFNVLAFRPKTRHQQLRNCYFVGASTHPGTGVPIVLAGAKITSEQILKDQNMQKPWENAGELRVSNSIDAKWSWMFMYVLMVLGVFTAIYWARQ